ncbi:GNAT family N-acetyltransferase [Burkholderia sp. BDU5]|uniref:GNAT family N-acetyltransferase n=1 Tax=Burkholderia sp. BDU5 TaxID=1385590 RepID=UPI001E284C0D|nr:GNAT family N-acetyltransferase [Burkholderia sp. BDU5]
MTDVCELSETLSEAQREMVADNGTSIAEAHFSENAWFRAIYADETLVGFIMLHIGADHDDGIDCPGVFLWRFMIAGPYQRTGIGRKAIDLLVRNLRLKGFNELHTSYGLGDGSPEGFYRRLGFSLTGGAYGDELEVVLSLDDYGRKHQGQ